ncbi:MAG: nuclear transport factor 2 family protein [Candidatus Sulfotelmatobacter sp.]|jgi:hypothetical protein
MKIPAFCTRFLSWAGLSVSVSLVLLSQPIAAQKNGQKTAPSTNVQQELVRTEIGFHEAWKTKDETYFRAHMAEDGISWGESGTLSRDQQLQQLTSAKACNAEGYGLSDFGVLPLTSGAYLLTYKVDQYATCNGERAPVHMNGSSIYVLRSGHWEAIYRAEVPSLAP